MVRDDNTRIERKEAVDLRQITNGPGGHFFELLTIEKLLTVCVGLTT